MRNNKVICECGFEPYPAGMWHASYSMCKSVTGMAVGMLIGEGRLRLQDKVIDLFGGKKNLLNIFRLKDITVEHLLTMTSCVSFNETGIVSGNDWVRGYLESGLIGVPGKKFEYNSMNSYMLSAIITEVTGESLMDYLRPRLWEPMGIHKVFGKPVRRGLQRAAGDYSYVPRTRQSSVFFICSTAAGKDSSWFRRIGWRCPLKDMWKPRLP